MSLNVPTGPPAGPTTVAGLAALLRGAIVTPADPAWDEVRLAWNLAADQRPALVALPVHVLDVAAVLDFAQRYGLRVATQSTGHGAAAIPTLEDTVLLSTRHMRGVEVDPERRVARVQAGTRWGEVAAAATEAGLFPLAGSSPHVGVVGSTLGGGLSWLGRRHGLAANHVTAIELVTPAGALVRATPHQHPDLFWALRGGGGNFGVVTALELELLPYGSVYAGMFVWPYERHAEVADAWYAVTRRAPEELTTSLRVLHVPPAEDVPDVVGGRSVVVVDGAFAGDPAAGEAAVADLRRRLAPEVDTWAPATPVELGHMHMDPDDPLPFTSDAMFLDDMGPGGLRALTAILRPGTPLLFGEVRHLGGALARTPEGAGPVATLPGEYLAVAVGVVTDPDDAVAVDVALQEIRDEMVAYDTGCASPNFADWPVDPGALYADEDYQRLRAIRTAVDPNWLMVANHPIPPLVPVPAATGG